MISLSLSLSDRMLWPSSAGHWPTVSPVAHHPTWALPDPVPPEHGEHLGRGDPALVPSPAPSSLHRQQSREGCRVQEPQRCGGWLSHCYSRFADKGVACMVATTAQLSGFHVFDGAAPPSYGLTTLPPLVPHVCIVSSACLVRRPA